MVLGGKLRSGCSFWVYNMCPGFLISEGQFHLDIAWLPWQGAAHRINSAIAFVLKIWICSVEMVIVRNNISIPHTFCFLLTYRFVHKKHEVRTENWTWLNQTTQEYIKRTNTRLKHPSSSPPTWYTTPLHIPWHSCLSLLIVLLPLYNNSQAVTAPSPSHIFLSNVPHSLQQMHFLTIEYV